MKHLRYALIAFGLSIASQAEASTCFWVGGTATWDGTNTGGGGTGGIKWASSTGGSTACTASSGPAAGVPGPSDTATFDGSSGGGTVTANPTGTGLTLNTLAMGSFTGTLDFSVNNPSMTLGGNGAAGFSVTGTGVRTLKLGSGTFTLKTSSNNGWDATVTTNMTFNGNTATLKFSTPTTTGSDGVVLGALSYAGVTFQFGPITNGSLVSVTGSSTTVANMDFTGPAAVQFPSITFTVTGSINSSGSAGSEVFISNGNSASSLTTLSQSNAPTITWSGLRGLTFSGVTSTATSSFDLGANSGITITAPSGGSSGGHIIGG